MLKINQLKINNASPINKLSSQFKALLPPNQLGQDIFISSKNQFLQSSKSEIFKAIDLSIKDENFLGEGSDAKVYKIPNTEYIVRLIKNKKNNGFVNYKKQLSFSITPRDKINHIVAKLGEGCSLMQHLKGTNLCEYMYSNELAELPQSIYYDLYKKICFAKANGMVFDFAPSNIIYDPNKKTLTPIDFIKKNHLIAGTLPLSDIFFSFADYLHLSQQTLNKIFNNLLEIAKKEINSKHPINNISKKDITEFFTLYKTYCETQLCQPVDKIEKEILSKFK